MGLSYVNQQSNNGTCTLIQAAAPGITWCLTSLSVSQSGPTGGPNAKVTIYDGTIATGTVIHAEFLGVPTGSVGTTQEIKIPKDGANRPALQATPGNAMTIHVIGTGVNNVSINARFVDGLPVPL